MKASRITLFIFPLMLYMLISSMPTEAVDISQQVETIPVYLTIQVRDYNTGIAVANLSVTVGVYTNLGWKEISNRTSEIGVLQTTLGSIEKNTVLRTILLQYVDLSENYTLIKVQNTFLERLQMSSFFSFRSRYSANQTYYNVPNIPLSNRVLTDRQYVEGVIWILRGKLVRVLDCDPVTRTHQNLIVTPAILTNIPSNVSEFERLYFFPLDYEVTMYHETPIWQNIETEKLRYGIDPISPMLVTIDAKRP